MASKLKASLLALAGSLAVLGSLSSPAEGHTIWVERCVFGNCLKTKLPHPKHDFPIPGGSSDDESSQSCLSVVSPPAPKTYIENKLPFSLTFKYNHTYLTLKPGEVKIIPAYTSSVSRCGYRTYDFYPVTFDRYSGDSVYTPKTLYPRKPKSGYNRVRHVFQLQKGTNRILFFDYSDFNYRN